MMLAYDGTADSDARLAQILSRHWSIRNFTTGRDPVPAGAAAVLIFDHTLTPDGAAALHGECDARRVPLTIVSDRGRHVQIGPLFAQWLVRLCPRCATQRLLNAPPDGVPLDKAILQRRVASQMTAVNPPQYPRPLLHLVAATLTAQLRDPDGHAGRVVLLDSVGFTVTRATLTGLHGCPACRRDSHQVAPPPFIGTAPAVRPTGAVA